MAERVDRQVDALDEESLGAINTALPIESLSLMDLSLHVAARCVGLAREQLAAVDALEDAAADQCETILSRLAASAHTLGNRLSKLGRREEALAASQEAVDLYRRLAQARPDAFLPDLARSISVTSDVLTAFDRPTEATQAAHQALEILAPFVELYPATFADLAHEISADLLQYSDAAQQAPDRALLERVARALDGGETAAEDPAIEALKP